MIRRDAICWILLLGAVLSLAVAAPVSATGEPGEETEQYVRLVEPICKTNVLANKRIFQGAKQQVKNGELKRAAKHFTRAASAFAKTITQMAEVPRPPADTAKLGKWFTLLKKEKAIIQKIGVALAAEEKHKAQSYALELNRNSNKANNAVLGFGFNYCRIEPSRFG